MDVEDTACPPAARDASLAPDPAVRAAAVPRLLAGGGLIVAVLLLGMVVKLGPVARLDLRIDRHIAAHDRTAALTALTKAVSIAGEPVIGVALMVALPVILVLLRRRRDALAAFCMMGGGLALAAVVKLLINEHRPPLQLQAAGADLSPSYPSGHTTTAAIIAVTLIVIAATFVGRVIAIALGIPYALAVAASRVYLGYHYPPDVVGAFLCALAAAFIVTGLAALPVIQPQLRRFLLLSWPVRRCRARSCRSDSGMAQHREVRGPQRIRPVPQPGGNRVALAHLKDRGEAGPASQIRHLFRGEGGEPGLTALRRRRGDQRGVTAAVGVTQVLRQHVVGDQFAATREPSDGRQGLADRLARQVHGHP
jgi:membrane-associated phospholipid phosphatase